MNIRKFDFSFKKTADEEFDKNADTLNPVRIVDIKAKKRQYLKILPNNGNECNIPGLKYESYRFLILFKSKNEKEIVGNQKSWVSDLGLYEDRIKLLKEFRQELVHLSSKDSNLSDYSQSKIEILEEFAKNKYDIKPQMYKFTSKSLTDMTSKVQNTKYITNESKI